MLQMMTVLLDYGVFTDFQTAEILPGTDFGRKVEI